MHQWSNMCKSINEMHAYSVTQLCLTLWPTGLPVRLVCPWDFPGKNTGVACHFLLQGIFPTQGSNLHLLHCRQILYHWATWEAQRSALNRNLSNANSVITFIIILKWPTWTVLSKGSLCSSKLHYIYITRVLKEQTRICAFSCFGSWIYYLNPSNRFMRCYLLVYISILIILAPIIQSNRPGFQVLCFTYYHLFVTTTLCIWH